MKSTATQLSQTGQDPDTYCGLLYCAEYEYLGETRMDDFSDYLTWDAAKEALVNMLSRLTVKELEYVRRPFVTEVQWDNGQGEGVSAKEIDIVTFDWKD